MSKPEVRSINILLVEDNPGDVVLTQEAFRQSKIANEIHVVNDGEMALDYLYQRNGFEDQERPDLVLLDLNLPKVDGREVLEAIKSDDGLKTVPVVILTSSDAECDIVKTYDLHANSYVVKPISMAAFVKIVSAIENFWFTVVALPHLSE